MSRGGFAWRALLALALAAGLLGGCARTLIPTPYVMEGEAGRRVFERIDPSLRTTDIPVLYVTDRAIDRETETGPRYGYGRSPDVTFGVATVSVSPAVTWEEFVGDSTSRRRAHSYTPRVSGVEKKGAFRSTTSYIEPIDGEARITAQGIRQIEAELGRFNEALDAWLDRAERKEVVIFVHGYNNTFDDAVIRMAQTWHFSGRQGVPIAYTWPAGSGGLKGYGYDRESGEFTVVHLKLLMWALAVNPKVERVHLVSHSRGTDVASTALRELHAEIRGYQMGKMGLAWMGMGEKREQVAEYMDVPPTWRFLKLETLVLAAPDLDLDVFLQRFFGENVIRAAHRTAIYFSEDDGALGLADWLFRSRRRVGALRLDDFKPEVRPLLSQIEGLELINARVTGHSSHSYLLQHPAALSDLILLLRDGKGPGQENGRPLQRPFAGVWELEDEYLKSDEVTK